MIGIAPRRETIFDVDRRKAGYPVLTVYLNGTWRIEGSRDAELSAEMDEDYVTSISIRDICLATGAIEEEAA